MEKYPDEHHDERCMHTHLDMTISFPVLLRMFLQGICKTCPLLHHHTLLPQEHIQCDLGIHWLEHELNILKMGSKENLGDAGDVLRFTHTQHDEYIAKFYIHEAEALMPHSNMIYLCCMCIACESLVSLFLFFPSKIILSVIHIPNDPIINPILWIAQLIKRFGQKNYQKCMVGERVNGSSELSLTELQAALCQHVSESPPCILRIFHSTFFEEVLAMSVTFFWIDNSR